MKNTMSGVKNKSAKACGKTGQNIGDRKNSHQFEVYRAIC